MNGADRFQLFFDASTRKTTRCGNVIRAKISVVGNIDETTFREIIYNNEAVNFLSSVYPKRKWYSTIYKWHRADKINISQILHFHHEKITDEKLEEIYSTDCILKPGSTIRIDVIYEGETTLVIISVNHVLIDYAGMENLIASIAGNKNDLILEKYLKHQIPFYKKFSNAISATAYVAARTSWNIRRLKRNNLQPSPILDSIELAESEYATTKKKLQQEIKSTALPFYVACLVNALNKNTHLLSDKRGDFFIAVPLNRRPSSFKNVLTANYLSFIYFHSNDAQANNVKTLAANFNSQLIEQGRKKMPEKFISLLDLFRFLPPVIYNAWMKLPTKGHATTFAFSLLGNSFLENNLFVGLQVSNVTHYAPVITPPGLNVVFNEFRGKLKITVSYDENRITKQQMQKLITDIRNNLLN